MKDPDSVKYKQMRDYYNDYGYGEEISTGMGFYPNEFLADRFIDVTVTCDLAYDEDHPRGSSLNDICRLYTVTPFEYIRAGYNGFDWGSYDHANEFHERFPEIFDRVSPIDGSYYRTTYLSCLYPVRKLLPEIGPDDLKLLGRGNVSSRHQGEPPFAVLEFVVPPTLTSTPRINVTMKNDEGRVFEGSVALEFQR